MVSQFGALRSRAKKLQLLFRLRPFDTSTPEGRAAERHRRAALSAFASVLANIVSVGSALISVPLTLHYLGAERFGMWMIISSLIAILSFADFGIGNGILNAVAAAHGRGDREAIRGYVSSGFFILTATAIAVIFVFAAAYRFVPWPKLFNVQTELARNEAGPALAVFVCCFALAIPMGIVQRVQTGLQRGFIASLWQCMASLLGLASIILAIKCEAGLPWLVLALFGSPLVVSTINSIFFFGRVQPAIAPVFASVSREHTRKIANTGGLFFVLQIAFALTFASDTLVISQILGADAVPEFTVPDKMFGIILTVVSVGLAPLWPAYGEAIARRDFDWVRRTFTRSLIVAIGLAACGSMTLVVLGPWLIKLWVGKSVVVPLSLLIALGLWRVMQAGGNAVAMFLNGANVVRFQVLMVIPTAIFSLAAKIIFVRIMAVPGVVWGTMLVYLLCTAIPCAIYLRRTIMRNVFPQ